MRDPLRTVLACLAAFILATAAHAEDADVASSLPEDIPGGRDEAAKALKSGVPQLVKKALEDLMFAQEAPAFAPWRVALEGRAAGVTRELWSFYVNFLIEREIEALEFRESATTWLEGKTDLTPEISATLGEGLRLSSEVLAKRHEAPARAGNMRALMSLAGNPAGHSVLAELCKSDLPEPDKFAFMMAASHTQSVAFRPLFEAWIASSLPQPALFGTNGILRLGEPADVKLGARYLSDPRTYRRFEVFRSLSLIKTRDAADVLIAEQPRCQEMNREAVVIALSRQRDERVLPLLRKLRDSEGYTRGVCAGLWRVGRAGDVPWLLEKMDGGEMEAALSLRRLLGKGCPIEFAARVDGVKNWIAEHQEAIEKDAELPAR